MERLFGKTKDGKEVYAYTIKNEKGMEVTVITYGATVTSVKVRDKNGRVRDVALGYDSVSDYETNTYYFGAVIGRNSNRISNAKCVIDGIEYRLDANHYENNLHSGNKGCDAVVWNAEYNEMKKNQIIFTYFSKDLEQGFPGNMSMKVSYEVTEDNEIVITYDATTDKTTLANFTSHVYYNLDGHDAGSIEAQELMIPASQYTPIIDEKAIPIGKNKDVAGTPFDFRVAKPIGKDIHANHAQIGYANGYDHNFALDDGSKDMKLNAKVASKDSGIVMEVFSDCPGIQFYAGNFIEEHNAKGGVVYKARQGFALEPQYYPDAVNVDAFETPLLHPGEQYHSETKVKFSVEA